MDPEIRRLIADPNRFYHRYEERDGVLVLTEGRHYGWTRGGPHGATCHGGPLDGETVIVNKRGEDGRVVDEDDPMKGSGWEGVEIPVEGRPGGVYVFNYSNPQVGPLIGIHRVGGLYWQPSEEP